MMYKVTKRFGRGSEVDVGKKFNNETEAKNYITEKLLDDYNFKIIDTIYSLYEGLDKISEFSQRDVKPSANEQSSSSQQKGSGQSFSPTPFQIGPRPKGMPVSGFKEDEKKDK